MDQDQLKDVLETISLEPIAPPEPAPASPPVEPPPAEPPVAPSGEPPVVPPAEPPGEPPVVPPVEPPAGLPGSGEPPPAEPPAVVPPAAPAADQQEELINQLRAQIAELSRLGVAAPPAPLAQPAPSLGEPAVPPITPAGPEPIVFFKDEAEVNAALENAGGFNAFLNKFAETLEARLSEKIIGQAVQRTIAMVPEVSANVASQQISVLSTVKSWYDANPDLLPFKEFCGLIVKQVAEKDPSLSMEKALEETEKEVRSRLRLVKSINIAPVAPGGAPPATPGFTPGASRGGGAQPPTLDKLQKDVLNTILD